MDQPFIDIKEKNGTQLWIHRLKELFWMSSNRGTCSKMGRDP